MWVLWDDWNLFLFSPQSRVYDLYATVNHYGTINCGHYVAQIKSYENQNWYQFDDNVVKKVRRNLFDVFDRFASWKTISRSVLSHDVLQMKSQLFKDGATFLSCSTAYLLMYRTGKDMCMMLYMFRFVTDFLIKVPFVISQTFDVLMVLWQLQ